MPGEAKQLARAVREHASSAVEKLGQKVVKGVVAQTGPLKVELLANDVVIDADFLLLGSWPRYYDRTWGIAEGDTVLLTRLDDGDWYVIDVLSQLDLDGGLDLSAITAISVTSRNGHIVARVPFYDTDDNLIGYVAVLSSVTGDGPPA